MEQDGRMYAELSPVCSPPTQFCVRKRVLQHFAELDLTSLFSLFLERLKITVEQRFGCQGQYVVCLAPLNVASSCVFQVRAWPFCMLARDLGCLLRAGTVPS